MLALRLLAMLSSVSRIPAPSGKKVRPYLFPDRVNDLPKDDPSRRNSSKLDYANNQEPYLMTAPNPSCRQSKEKTRLRKPKRADINDVHMV